MCCRYRRCWALWWCAVSKTPSLQLRKCQETVAEGWQPLPLKDWDPFFFLGCFRSTLVFDLYRVAYVVFVNWLSECGWCHNMNQANHTLPCFQAGCTPRSGLGKLRTNWRATQKILQDSPGLLSLSPCHTVSEDGCQFFCKQFWRLQKCPSCLPNAF